eukprot:6235930-Prymnesium_polylepis.1
MVTFASSDTAVAALRTGAWWDVVRGVAPGQALLRLAGRPSGPSAPVTVTDDRVTVTSLVAR